MITVITSSSIDPTKLKHVKLAMIELVNSAIQEEGCLNFHLYQDKQKNNRFIFNETWASCEFWQQHREGDAIKKFNTLAADHIINFEVQEMTKLV